MGHLVAVKTLKDSAFGDSRMKVSISETSPATQNAISTDLFQLFCKQVVLWSTLSHPNVLELVGVQGDMEKGQFVTVSEWMMHGNIMDYIKENHANRLELVRGFPFPITLR